MPDYTVGAVEERIVAAAADWSDHLREALVDAKGEVEGLGLFRRYRNAFPTSYRERTIAPAAIFDIDLIECVIGSGDIGLNLYRPIEADDHQVHFKLYHPGGPAMLSDVLPMLEHMGLKVVAEIPAEVRPVDQEDPIWIHDFAAESRAGTAIDLTTVKQSFHTAFHRVWKGDMEDDGFNRLVIGAGLEWRQVVVLRAYAKFLRQAGIAFSRETLESALAAHPQIARLVVRLFEIQFDPDRGDDRQTPVAGIRVELDHLLDAVDSLNEDRILRRFINLVGATLRTNYYQRDDAGEPKPYLAFKLDSREIDELPLPRPWREVFVYSSRVEAVHLRGGRVARGGIRWSDRREDFRTEVLGLMKAQMVKNAVIVPVGSKGGFVVKRPPRNGDREALLAEGIECYKTLMRGLLDLTDNMVDGAVVSPPKAGRPPRR